MDHRALGLLGSQEVESARESVDLATFLRSASARPPVEAPPATPATVIEEPREDPGAGEAPSLMRPPVDQIKTIAREIRVHAEGIVAPAPTPSSQGSAKPPARAGTVPTLPAKVAASSRSRAATEEPASPPTATTHPAARKAVPRPYPASLGTFLGTVAGGAVGAALAALEASSALPPLPWVFTRIPAAVAGLGLPGPASRGVMLAILGALSGFITAATGTPGRRERPLTLLRCLSYAMLAGAAAGLTAALLQGDGLETDPVIGWTKDLLAAGLLTWVLGRLAGRRSG